jgi:integrase
VGKVSVYLHHGTWWVYYREHGSPVRNKVSESKDEAEQVAAQVNAQLVQRAPTLLSFQPVSVPDLRRQFLDHHEHVLKSAVCTLSRYRTATEHLLRFLEQNPVRHASHFQVRHAERFVVHLRGLSVSPNGHANTARRPLMDKGLRFVLECCRALFAFAAKRRHLSPYAENPFTELQIDRIPVEQARPITLLTPRQERAFIEACDDWQLPLFLPLVLTGLRPGELCHLLLPDDLDLGAGLLRVRNKPRLGWQVKTRNQRDVPLVLVLAEVLRVHLGQRRCGPVFRRRRWTGGESTATHSAPALEQELARRCAAWEAGGGRPPSRAQRASLARRLWREVGAPREDRVRLEFMKLTAAIGLPG